MDGGRSVHCWFAAFPVQPMGRHGTGLRSPCASALILAGTDCLEVAKFLGHAKPTVTMSAYAHWFNTRKTAGTMSTVAGAVFSASAHALEVASDKGSR